MGYLYLLIALLAGKTKGYCGKLTSGYTKTFRDAIWANTVRMGLCVVIGLGLVLFTEGPKNLLPSGKLLAISALSGVSNAIFVATWLICVKNSAFMLMDIFLMLGVLFPLVASSIFFQEAVTITQWLGIGVLFLSVIIMCSYNNTIKTKLTLPALVLLIICGSASGIADFSQKLFTKQMPGASVAVFNLYTYIFGSLSLLIAFWATKKGEAASEKADFRKMFGYILIMAVCLFLNSYFKTLASKYLSAVLLYPLNQGCSLILSAVVATTLLKEKLTGKAILGTVIAFIGLLIINVL